MKKPNYRKCSSCQIRIPPETSHYVIDNTEYCFGCVEAVPYTSHSYYNDGEYMGNSESDNDAQFIEHYEDDYEEESQ